MFLKQINQNRAVGAFVFVMAFDAVTTCNGNPPWVFAILLAIMNFPGVLLVIALAFWVSFGIGNDVNSGVFKFLSVIGALWSAGFWSLMFGYVFQSKKMPNPSPETSAVGATESATRSTSAIGGGSGRGR